MKWLVLLLWGLGCLSAVAQEEGAYEAPGGPVQRFRVAQGPIVLMQPNPQLPVAAIAVCVPLGSSRNPATRGGAAQLLGYLARRSTVDYPEGSLAALEDELGARCGYEVGPERTVFWQVVPRNQVSWALQAALGRLKPPPLTDQTALRAYRALRSEWRTTAPVQRQHQQLAMLAYGSSAPTTLVASSSADLAQLGLQLLTNQDSVVAVVGGFDPQAVRADLEKTRLNLGPSSLPPLPRSPVALESEPSPKVEWLWPLPTKYDELAHLLVIQEYLRERGLEAETDWDTQTFCVRAPIATTAREAEAELRQKLTTALSAPYSEGWKRLQARAHKHWLAGIDDLGRRAVVLSIDQAVSRLDRVRGTPGVMQVTTPLPSLTWARAYLSEATACRGLPSQLTASAAPDPPADADLDLTRRRSRLSLTLPDYKPAPAGAPPFTRLELDRGVTLLVQPIRDLDTVTVRGYLESGTLLDSPAQAGRTQLLAQALEERAQPGDGMELKLDPQLQFLTVDGWTTREGLPDWLSAFFQAVGPGPLASEQVEKARQKVASELQLEVRQEEAQGYQRWLQLLYPEDHPLGRSSLQILSGVQQRTAAEVNALAGSSCRPERLVLIVSGNVTPEDVAARLLPRIAAWKVTGADPGPPQILAPVRPKPDSPPLLRLPGKGPQALILIGKVGPSRKDPDYYAFTLLNQILGGDPSGCRLAQRLRDKERLASVAQSRFLAGAGPMPWLISLRVDRDKVDTALGMVREELDRLRKEPPAAAELERAVHCLEGQLQVAQSSSWGRASLLRNLELFRLSDSYSAGFAGLYRGISAKDLLEVAKRRLTTEDLCTVVLSP